jgi:hypothetical protein
VQAFARNRAWFHQVSLRLGTAFVGARFHSTKSITDSLLCDRAKHRLQQEFPIRRRRSPQCLLKCRDRLQRPFEAQCSSVAPFLSRRLHQPLRLVGSLRTRFLTLDQIFRIVRRGRDVMSFDLCRFDKFPFNLARYLALGGVPLHTVAGLQRIGHRNTSG